MPTKTWKEVAEGDTVWIRDENRRVYGPDRRCIEREHYTEHKVVSVERMSLILNAGTRGGRPIKVARADGAVRNGAYGNLHATLDMEGDIYRIENLGRVSDAVRQIKDAALLREVARLIGIPEEKP